MSRVKTQLTQKEIEELVKIQDKLSALQAKYTKEEDEDYLRCRVDSSYTVADAIGCAIAGLETILQDYF